MVIEETARIVVRENIEVIVKIGVKEAIEAIVIEIEAIDTNIVTIERAI